MLNGAKQRSQLFDILGVRIIVSDRSDQQYQYQQEDIKDKHFSIHRIYSIISSLPCWTEDKRRYKDYV